MLERDATQHDRWVTNQALLVDRLLNVVGRDEFRYYVVEALRSLGGSGTVLEVTKRVWQVHEQDLRASGDLFYTWQYDVRWAAQHLRNNGYMKAVDGDRRAPWQLTELGRTADLPAIALSPNLESKR